MTWKDAVARYCSRRRDDSSTESLADALDRIARVDGTAVFTWNTLAVDERDDTTRPSGPTPAVRFVGSPHWHRIS